VSLTDAFTSYLRTRAGTDALAAELGNRPEARWLAQWNGVAQAVEQDGQRTWIGPTTPPDAQPHDLWLDVVEMMPMLLVPREDPPYLAGWIATRPVERWQFAAFLNVASIHADYAGPTTLFDRARILDGPEASPVTRVLRDEADLYAHWFGKTLATSTLWELVAEAPRVGDLGLGTEWGEEADEGAYRLVSPDNVHLDPLDGDDVPVLSAWEAPAGVTFRTRVHPQLGLRAQLTRAAEIPAQLRDVAAR
jgi:hypothetical protein